MKRREFLQTSTKVLCACVTGSGLSIIQSCTNNVAVSPDLEGDGDGLLIDITSSGFTPLLVEGGSVVTNGNAIDSRGLVLVRVGDEIKAYKNSCTHSGYALAAYDNGVSVCTSGHGGSFNTNGQAISSPASTGLKEYLTAFENNILTIFS